MSLKLNSSGGGSVTLQEPVTASDLTLNLPNASGVVNTSGAVNEVPAGSAAAPAITTTGDTNTGMFFPAADTIAFAEGGVEAMRLDSAGSMGVGINYGLTNSRLVVAGQSPGGNGAYATGPGSIVLNEGGRSSVNDIGGFEFKTSVFGSGYGAKIMALDAGTLVFGNRENSATYTERMRLNNSGDFMVGTTTSQARGNFVASSLDSGALYLASNAPNGPGGQIAQINTNAAGLAKYIRVVTNNNWQIVNSTYTAVIFDLTNAGAAFQGNNSSTWSTSSDIRIKTNVRQIGGALGKMMALKPCHFEYKNAIGETTTGFIAQEFEEVFPGHVKESTAPMQFEEFIEGEDKTIKTIDANLVPYLVKAIQELKAELDTVKAELAAMKGTA